MKENMITVVLTAAAIDGLVDEVELQEARTLLYGAGFSDEEIARERDRLAGLSGVAYMVAVLDAVYGCRESLDKDQLRKIFDTVFAIIMADGSVTEQEKAFDRMLNDVWSISRA